MTDFIKMPQGTSLNALATRRAYQATQMTGRALPCTVVAVVSSGIVTVNFQVNAAPYTLPQVTIPVQAWEYIRYPIQVGDKGFTVPADVRIGNISGLGGGIPGLDQPANLSALSFVPIGNAAWSETDDPDAVVIYGPNGVIARTQDGATSLTVNSDGVTVEGGDMTVTADHIALNGNVTITDTTLGLYGETAVIRQSVIGALSSVTDANAKAVLTSLINALNLTGIILKATT